MTDTGYMYAWEYQVRADRLTEFILAYRSNGEWVALFRRAKGYIGTELYRDREDPFRFVTIDRWVSVEAWQTFRAEFSEEFERLDARCEEYTDAETMIGTFSSVVEA